MIWLFLTIIAIMLQGFFSMQEMLLLSKEKVRLSYRKESDRYAKWSIELLENPELLFLTTLFCVNISLQFGSEVSKRFYDSIGLSQGISSLLHIVIVIIFSELAPVFAARKYTQAMSWGVSIIYGASRLFKPLINLFKIKKKAHINIGEDMKSVIRDWATNSWGVKQNLETSILHMQKLKNMKAHLLKQKIHYVFSFNTVSEALDIMYRLNCQTLVVRDHKKNRYIYLKDILDKPFNHNIVQYSKPIFLKSVNSSIIDIAIFFYHQPSEHLLQLVNDQGIFKGFLTRTITNCFYPIFSNTVQQHIVINKLFNTSISIYQLQKKYGIFLRKNPNITLRELIESQSPEPLEDGETILIDHFKIKVHQSNINGPITVYLESIV